jgi:methionyl aminopeptidase
MVKDADTIAAMRVAGRVAAQAIVEVGAHVRPGITTDELDAIGHAFLIEHGAYPSTLGYKGFPKSLCTSLNESVCHGIPDSTVIEDGDLVKVDITAFIGGVHGDTCATFGAGHVSDDSRLLSERTQEAMLRGIKAIRPGRPISVIGRVIESYARRFDYGVLRAYSHRSFAELPTFDLLEDVHRKLGRRLSLNHLATHTLGRGKSGDGLQSLVWWKEGRLAETPP